MGRSIKYALKLSNCVLVPYFVSGNYVIRRKNVSCIEGGGASRKSIQARSHQNDKRRIQKEGCEKCNNEKGPLPMAGSTAASATLLKL